MFNQLNFFIMENKTLVFSNATEFKTFLSTVKFMPTDANRNINDFNKNAIKLSVLEIGVKRSINIVYTDVFSDKYEYYFLDAQHLSRAILEIADELLRGHFCVMIDKIDTYEEIVYDISRLNSVGQGRKLIEYLRSWVFDNRKSYIFISELMSKNKDYSINSIIECLSGKKCSGNDDFKNGKLTFTKEQKNHTNRLIVLHRKLMKTGLKYVSNSFAALVRFNIDYPEVSFDTIYKNVKKSTADFKEIKGRDMFIAELKMKCIKAK